MHSSFHFPLVALALVELLWLQLQKGESPMLRFIVLLSIVYLYIPVINVYILSPRCPSAHISMLQGGKQRGCLGCQYLFAGRCLTRSPSPPSLFYSSKTPNFHLTLPHFHLLFSILSSAHTLCWSMQRSATVCSRYV